MINVALVRTLIRSLNELPRELDAYNRERDDALGRGDPNRFRQLDGFIKQYQEIIDALADLQEVIKLREPQLSKLAKNLVKDEQTLREQQRKGGKTFTAEHPIRKAQVAALRGVCRKIDFLAPEYRGLLDELERKLRKERVPELDNMAKTLRKSLNHIEDDVKSMGRAFDDMLRRCEQA